ncbi:hypothetical protein [Thermococcus sp.]|uniref:hypothetical protein n=1 Tax=Thermococcus sp. TaxID=35749 RepID=UPI002636A53E|nr:hypothetical protein [Thermococcus sp.]
MVLHSRPEGFVYDDDNREGIIFTGSKSGSTIALSFAAYLKTSAGEEVKPLHIITRVEKLREEPSEFWTEDLLTDVLRDRGITVHGLEIHNGRKMITATIRMEIGVRVRGKLNRERVEELSDAVLHFLEEVIGEIVYWDRYVPEGDDDLEDDLFWEFTERDEDEDSSEDVFNSIEFWWEKFHGEEKP